MTSGRGDGRRNARTHALVLLGYVGLACVTTWPIGNPQALGLPHADDAYFNVWRLAWVAHQLPRDPLHLFDANIFSPARDTFALSDAMLLVGVLGAPLIWLGVDPAGVHNVLLLAALATSAFGAYGLCYGLTRDRGASMVGGLVFGVAPYRFAHLAHMELQWTVWMPAAIWALHRMMAEPRIRRGLLLGALIAGQILCSLYYGAFLVLFLAVATGLLLIGRTRRLLLPTAISWGVAALIVAAIAGPYTRPYARVRAQVGERSMEEVARYSATPRDYLRGPEPHWLFGPAPADVPAEERSLLPGLIAAGLACAALWPPVATTARIYVVLLAFAFDASLGVNGISFNVMRTVLPPLASLRAPARFGVLALLCVAVLAVLGLVRMTRPLGSRRRAVVVAVVAAACLIEYWSAPLPVRPPLAATEATRWLALQPPDTVVVEVPMPEASRLWLHESAYQYRSIYHWRRLVNGYSGFAPLGYFHTLDAMRTFPDDESLARLRELSVDWIVLHAEHLGHERYEALVAQVLASDALSPFGEIGTGTDRVFLCRLLAQDDGDAAEAAER
jgi:hypothetical protein